MTEDKTFRIVRCLLARLPLVLFLSAIPSTLIYNEAPREPTGLQNIDVYFWGEGSRFVTSAEAAAFYTMYLIAFVLAVCWLYALSIKWRDDKAEF